jgi:hypothetical protein
MKHIPACFFIGVFGVVFIFIPWRVDDEIGPLPDQGNATLSGVMELG